MSAARRATIGLHADHLDNLSPAGDRLAQISSVAWGERAAPPGLDLLGERGNDRGVDRVGLGEPAERAREVSDLARVDDGERQAGAGEGRRDSRFEAACRFQHDERHIERREAFDEIFEAFAVARDGKGLVEQ